MPLVESSRRPRRRMPEVPREVGKSKARRRARRRMPEGEGHQSRRPMPSLRRRPPVLPTRRASRSSPAVRPLPKSSRRLRSSAKTRRRRPRGWARARIGTSRPALRRLCPRLCQRRATARLSRRAEKKSAVQPRRRMSAWWPSARPPRMRAVCWAPPHARRHCSCRRVAPRPCSCSRAAQRQRRWLPVAPGLGSGSACICEPPALDAERPPRGDFFVLWPEIVGARSVAELS
mmetsp:Transcript_21879/g.61555  ORF Transcript_21879/g.61555 Transcript_21879/m.61555 type:complete len:232 (-) Transcript_21879:72-767(-)